VNVLIEAREVAVARGARRVIEGVSVALRAGEALALVGPNAAGKSTLVRALAGLLPPAAGQILLEGAPLARCSRDAIARVVALVTPGEDGADALTVLERTRLGRYPHRGALRPFTAEDDAAVARALIMTGIEALADRRLGTLSAGERQLAAVARGLAQEPRVLLLDEPSAHLDVGHQLQLFRVLDEVRRGGVGVLAVVHELQRAASWAERMVLLANGRIVAEGLPGDVLAGEACAHAFGVAIRRHEIAGLARPLYSFEDAP
jgi:iron complex transport system ATP-binding protein